MKIKIEKLPHGDLRVELVDGAKSPIVLILSPQEADALIGAFQTARKADRFSLTWES